MSHPIAPFQPDSKLDTIFAMDKLRDPWVRGVALTLFVVIILATATRVSPPTPLTGERPVAGPAAREAAFTPSGEHYAWLNRRQRARYEPLAARIPPPDGCARVKLAACGFANWLRHLPAAPADTPVTTGRRKVVMKPGDPRLAAVLLLQPTNDRLLAGANMLLRLRAEFLWSGEKLDGIGFHFTSGHLATWESWAKGERPRVKGRDVSFEPAFDADAGRESYCSYLETIFQYASGHSVSLDTTPVTDGSVAPGDIFLRNARKGSYALMVLDACTGPNGELHILLADAGMPAQTLYIPRGSDGGPWLAVSQSRDLVLADGRALRLADLRRWK